MANYVTERKSIILPLCKGKDVLDMGCVGEEKSYTSPNWLHGKICEVAANCLGVDISYEDIKKLRELGYNVICGNAETIDPGRKFDVIVAGEIIEHVSNQGLFLENMRRHLKDNGIMIITTPNAFYPGFILPYLLRKPLNINPRHTLWHSEETLRSIVERHGFLVNEIYYCTEGKPRSLKGKLYVFFMPRFGLLRSVGGTLIAILTKRKNGK